MRTRLHGTGAQTSAVADPKAAPAREGCGTPAGGPHCGRPGGAGGRSPGSGPGRDSSARALLLGCRVVLVAALSACTAPAPTHAPNRNGLYDQMLACLAETEPRAPCAVVDRARGFVVIKDDSPAKPDAWLIVPATEVTGIEDPRALRPPVVNFWGYGWEVGGGLLRRPRQDAGLAINSKAGRSQDLLHIHISCVQPAVRDALAAARIGPDWSAAPFLRLDGNAYSVRKVASLDPSPFVRLLELPGAGAEMAAQSLAVIGAADGGFYLVTDSTEPGVVAEAEALLDEACR